MSENILHSPAMYRDMVTTAIPELETVMPKETASEVARRIAVKFCGAHAGKTYLVPVLKRDQKIARDKLIRKQAQTMSVQAIAREHGLTVDWVYKVIRGE